MVITVKRRGCKITIELPDALAALKMEKKLTLVLGNKWLQKRFAKVTDSVEESRED